MKWLSMFLVLFLSSLPFACSTEPEKGAKEQNSSKEVFVDSGVIADSSISEPKNIADAGTGKEEQATESTTQKEEPVVKEVIPKEALASTDEKTKVPAPFYKNISAKEAFDLIQKDKELVLLDVRTEREYSGGHLAKSKNIDFYNSQFSEMLKPLDKGKKYLVYCASGGRSGSTLKIMKTLGFKYVYNMLGGYGAWSRGGYPTTR